VHGTLVPQGGNSLTGNGGPGEEDTFHHSFGPGEQDTFECNGGTEM